MGKEEFFLLLPAIIYGVAVVDLLKVFRQKNNYWELIIWGALLMVYVIVIWLELWSKLDEVASDKWFFILTTLKAIVLALTSAVLTPELKDKDTKKYFLDHSKRFFLLIALIVVINFFLQEFFYDDQRSIFFRLALLAIFLLCALVNKLWFRTASWFVVMFFLFSIIVKM